MNQERDGTGCGVPVPVPGPGEMSNPLAAAFTLRPTSVAAMRCPECAEIDDKVVDSRLSDEGRVTRRRRECLACGFRFTTFERLDHQPAMVTKRNGDSVRFEAAKLESSVLVASKGRPIDETSIDSLVARLEESARSNRDGIATERLGLDVLEWLADQDPVAYLRFASVYKGFDDPEDFQREARLLKMSTSAANQ